MPFSASLKNLLTAFVTVYEKHFSKTFRYTLLWTVLCFAVGQAIATYSNYAPTVNVQPVSVLSFFVLRFSYNSVYCYADLVKTVFIFLVSVFSINLIRKITFKDIAYLLAIFIVCCLLDCALFRVEGQLKSGNPHLLRWIHGIIFLLRIYLPLILFALMIQICIAKSSFSFKKIVYLFVALWLFNEVFYEFLTLVRSSVFDLILSPFQTLTYRYVGESLLGLPLIAASFLGYYCAMVMPFKLLENDKA